MTDESALRERLAELAGDLPMTPVDPAGLWSSGVRRQRRRRAAYAGGGLAAAVALVAGVALGGQVVGESAEPGPAVPPVSELHLPDRILRPHPWSEGTAEAGEIGPLAAIGTTAERLHTRGWADEVGSYDVFGVSAVDGTSRFIDFGVDQDAGEQVPWGGGSEMALSPDGRVIAFELRLDGARPGPLSSSAVGWRLYDTVTGETSTLRDPERAEIWNLGDNLVFTADSRYLVTTYTFEGTPTARRIDERSAGLVAWDVETGERIVLEEPGRSWQPGIGTAPRGLLIERKFQVRHVDPAAGEIERFPLPKAVVSSSIGPDGKAFAYVGGEWTPGPDGGINGDTWRLYAGPDRNHLEQVDLPEGDYTGLVLGWSDASHVIVNGWGRDFAEVDVVTGEVRTFTIPGAEGGPATMAHDLWANDLVPAVEPPGAGDPRTVWKIGLSVAAAGVALLLLRRGRRRRAR